MKTYEEVRELAENEKLASLKQTVEKLEAKHETAGQKCDINGREAPAPIPGINAGQASPAKESFTSAQRVKNLSIEMFGQLVNGYWNKAEDQLLEIIKGALLAGEAGQEDFKKISREALKALKTYQYYTKL